MLDATSHEIAAGFHGSQRELILTCTQNRIEDAQILIKNLDCSFYDNFLFRCVARKGLHQILQLLLEKAEVNPLARNGEAWIKSDLLTQNLIEEDHRFKFDHTAFKEMFLAAAVNNWSEKLRSHLIRVETLSYLQSVVTKIEEGYRDSPDVLSYVMAIDSTLEGGEKQGFNTNVKSVLRACREG